MDPRSGIPLHFTIESLGLAVAGVLLAWSGLQRRWLIAGGALAIAMAQIMFAGQFVAANGSAAVIAGVLRLAGVGAVTAGVTAEPELRLFSAGAAGVVAGTIWRLVAPGDAVSLGIGQRVFLGLGFAVMAGWAWRRASASVRTRIVGASLGVVAVAVVLSGGAAARVGVSNQIDNARARLAEAVQSEQRRTSEREVDLLNRGALGSAVVTQLGSTAKTINDLRRQAFPDVDFLWLVGRDKKVIGTASYPVIAGGIATSSILGAAFNGDGATGVVAMPGETATIAVDPVFRSGAGRSRSDVTGVLVVGEIVTSSDLGAIADRSAPGGTAQLVSPQATLLSSTTAAPHVAYASLGGGTFSSGEAGSGGTRTLGAIGKLPFSEQPLVALAITVPLSRAADVSAAFPRALVAGVLASGLLAVVISLWLSVRLTRPILSLANEAERVKTEFLSTVSHELRTPLTPIRGYADLLRRERVPRRAEAYLDEIDEASQRLERIVGLLVEVAAMQAGRFLIEQEPVALSDILEHAAERWRSRSRKHRITVQVPKSLPRVSADPRSIATVVDELLDNALKFSPNGGAVELRAKRVGDSVQVSVSDQGIGLDPDLVEGLTNAFVQADAGETRRFGGIGLGLTYATGVLRAHGARLELTGQPDGGATFSFALPTIGMVSRMPRRARSS